jgi:hypothetical protein
LSSCIAESALCRNEIKRTAAKRSPIQSPHSRAPRSDPGTVSPSA